MDVLELIKSVGIKEKNIKDSIFISPIYNNDYVVARIDGFIQKFRVAKATPGWYKIKPKNLHEAKIVDQADFIEIDNYFKLLTQVRMILIYKSEDVYLGVPLKNNSLKLDFTQVFPVYLVSEDQAGAFENVVCGYDGANFWYRQNDISSDPARTEHLRESFEKLVKPEKVAYKGLTLEERVAYSIRFSLDKKARESLKEISIKKDVELAGGEFVRFIERNDHFSITYKVGKQEYTSYVSKDTSHHVLTAGVCLQGKDRDFDLATLIPVLREGQRKGLIHRFHNTTG